MLSAPTCSYVANADKTSGKNYKILPNKSHEACCAACWADTDHCGAYVRATAADSSHPIGTCFLITGNSNNATRKSSNREVGFTNLPPPPPVIEKISAGLDLLAMADADATVVRPFAEPPSGFFLGSGTTNAPKEYVYTTGHPIAPPALDGLREEGQCASWVEGDTVPFNATASSAPQQINLSPRLTGARVILLGEAYKYAAVSTYRFGRVDVVAGGGLSVTLRGNIGEKVVLRFVEVLAGDELGVCQRKEFTLPKNGETGVSVP